MSALILLLTLFLGGCCHGTDPGAPPIDLGFVTVVVSAILARRRLRPRGGTGIPAEQAHIDRHRVFFAARRTKALGLAHESLRTPAGLSLLQEIVEAELEQIDLLASEMLGTADTRGAYFGGPDISPLSPPHLEIGSLSTLVRAGDQPATIADAVAASPPDVVQARVLAELDLRRQRFTDILWRAAALDDELWEDTADPPAPRALKRLETVEIIDRRLRSVERLRYEACSGVTSDSLGPSAIPRQWGSAESRVFVTGSLADALNNSWWDDFLQRRFESPSVPAPEFQALFQGKVVDQPDQERFQTWSPELFVRPLSSDANASTWYKNRETDQFDWNLWPGTAVLPPRFHTSGTVQVVFDADGQDWRLAAPAVPGGRTSYGWVLQPRDQPSHRPADIVTSLFMPAGVEWWKRRWLHADGVLSAIHLEALLHARRRRGESDDSFNQLTSRWDLVLDDHFGVRGYPTQPNSIMRPGRTEFFENAAVPIDDLQVGDQVLLETNLIVFAIASWWDYPTMLVTSVDAEADGDALALRALRLQGFGTADLSYPSLQHLLSQAVDGTLRAVQDRITELVAARLALIASGGPFELQPLQRISWDTGRAGSRDDRFEFDMDILRRWSPYGDAWAEPGAWWIRIDLDEPMWHGAFGANVAEAVAKLHKSVAWIDTDTVLVQSGTGVTSVPLTAGFVPPPGANVPDNPHRVIFVPLFEPTYEASGFSPWLVYFHFKHSGGAGEEFPLELRRVQADATWLPRLARESGMIRVIRPRLSQG